MFNKTLLLNIPLFISILAACSQNPPHKSDSETPRTTATNHSTSSSKVNNGQEVTINYNDNTIIFDGIRKFHKPASAPTGNPKNIYFIKSWLNKTTGSSEHQLYLTDNYTSDSGWKSWQSASEKNNSSLELIRISQSKDCAPSCNYTENIAVKIPNKLLDQSLSKGLELTLKAKNGDQRVIIVTPQQISVQLGSIAIITGMNPSFKNHVSGQETGKPVLLAPQKTKH